MTVSRVLIVGGGSIGVRHLRNLKLCSIESVAMVEPDATRRDYLIHNELSTCFNTLDEGLNWQPQLTIVASPTNFHVEHALRVVREDCHVFVEKPLSHRADGLHELCLEAEKRGLVTLVGCNMRFHPGPSTIKALIDAGKPGKILFARIHTGSYLPQWRPYQDYRKSYSAHADLGGGCILDCIHEIDLARWYLGDVEEVICVSGKLSELEINVEDVAALICTHRGRVLSEIHLDYVQRTYERGCRIVGELGSLFWDFREGLVKWFDAQSDQWHQFAQPPDWDTNTMYVDELKHLLECIQRSSPTILPIPEAVEVMKIALAAKQSARTGGTISTSSIAM